jgi:hypothetical protein
MNGLGCRRKVERRLIGKSNLNDALTLHVMAGLVPAIHVFAPGLAFVRYGSRRIKKHG